MYEDTGPADHRSVLVDRDRGAPFVMTVADLFPVRRRHGRHSQGGRDSDQDGNDAVRTIVLRFQNELLRESPMTVWVERACCIRKPPRQTSPNMLCTLPARHL